MALPTLPPTQPPPIPVSQLPTKNSNPGMELLFIVLMTFSFLWILNRFNPPSETKVQVEAPEIASQETFKAPPLPEMGPESELAREKVEIANKKVEPVFVTLGSLDPQSEYRMLVTLTNRGAAVARLELNEKGFRDTLDRTGYLGQLVVDESIAEEESAKELPGVAIQLVGPGTPAQKAGLKKGDRIVSLAQEGQQPVAIDSLLTLRETLLTTRPGQTVTLEILDQKEIANLKELTPTAFLSLKAKPVKVELQAAPVSLLRPEGIVRSYNDYQNLRGLQGVVSSVGTTSSGASISSQPVAAKTTEKTDLPGKSDSSSPTGAVSDRSSDSPEAINSLIIDLERHLDDRTRKNNADPLSFLMTLGSYDDSGKLKWYPDTSKSSQLVSAVRSPVVNAELPATALRDGFWEYVAEESNENSAVFRKVLLPYRTEIRKIYSLEKGASPDDNGRKRRDAREYHLTLRVEIVNLDTKKPHKISYLLDGPTGLPIEGAWYSSGRKTGPGWGLYGLRDLVLQLKDKSVQVVKCSEIAKDKKTVSDRVVLDYIGVDTQYFQCTMIPARRGTDGDWHEGYTPLRVGSRDKDVVDLTNVSFRLKSTDVELAPSGQPGDRLSHEYQIFAGPKQQEILDQYELGDTLVYGWFWFVSKPLVGILHFFHDHLVFNYGLAIIMLTIFVRLLLFPLSMKQVVSSIKMQELQPQLKELKERYKDKPQEFWRAQQTLLRDNGVSSLSGCLPLFIQLPIFIGLYKALSLDVNLYGAPLFFENSRWCSNLSAPDMLVDWSSFWNSVHCFGFNMGHGMLYLGPFFNLLPMLTIVLFLVQQKFMMPPVVGDDEAAQQKRMMLRMMNFMMIFMGFMFFKIQSGLCIYFICSSLWGILERQFHPKSTPSEQKKSSTSSGAYRTSSEKIVTSYPVASRRKKNRGRRAEAAKPEEKSSWRKWWDDLLEKAKEQQGIAKAEQERRNRARKKK